MNRKKIIAIVVTLLLLIALPLVILLSQQRQDIRQRADLNNAVTLAFSTATFTVSEGNEFETDLLISPSVANLNSFDITLESSTDSIEFTDFTALPDSFTQIIKTIDANGKRIRILSINQNDTQFKGPRLGTVKMRAKGSGQGAITFQPIATVVTSRGVDIPLTISNTSNVLGSYIIPTPIVEPTIPPSRSLNTAP